MSDVTEVVNRNHQKKRPAYIKENPVALFLAKTAAMFPPCDAHGSGLSGGYGRRSHHGKRRMVQR